MKLDQLLEISKTRFLSLKWKAFFLTSSLLSVIFIIFVTGTSVTLDKQFNEKRNNTFAHAISELHSLIEQETTRLQQLAAATPHFEGMSDSLDKTIELKKSFRPHWEMLKSTSNLSGAALYANNTAVLLTWDLPRSLPLQELIQKTLLSQKPSWRVDCASGCYLFGSSPIFSNGNIWGVAVTVSPWNELLQKFKKTSGADISFVSKLIDSPVQDSLFDKTLATTLTNEELTALSSKISSFDELVSSLQIQTTFSNKVYELRKISSTQLQSSAMGEFIITEDVSAELANMEATLSTTIWISIAGLVVSELLLLAVLSKTLTRLRETTESLPLLAQNGFQQARDLLTKQNRRTIIRDESDILNSTTLSLSYQLEKMQSQLTKRAEQLEKGGELLKSDRDFIHGLLNTAHAVIITQDSLGTILMANNHAEEVTGYSQQEILGNTFSSLLPTEDLLPDLYHQLSDLLCGKTDSLQHETQIICKDGSPLHMAWYHSRLPTRGNKNHTIMTVGLDISERKKAEDHMTWLASHDTLTGLYNRRKFAEEIESAITDSQSSNQAGAVLYFDLDQFKDVNDTSGHHVGDSLLKIVSSVLKETARDSDVIARLGGDEFAMILRDTDAKDASITAQRYCQALSKIEVQGKGRSHRASSSIGIALFPAHGEHIDELLANADIAMYSAKDAGRNGWHLFSYDAKDRVRVQERVYWNEKVKQVIAEDMITIHFQALVNVATQQVTHYEALLRVIDENGQLLAPGKFIQSAEQSGLINELDQRVMEKVFHYKSLLEAEGNFTPISLNLSGLSFKNRDLANIIANKISRHNIDPTSIIFEITETAAVADVAATIATMEKIKEMGCQFSLDDFGVGFSSLYFLKQLPIDYVKIDGSFIQHLHEHPDDQVLVKALVDVANAFGQRTVAEFVEHPNTLKILNSLGVNYAQGFLLHRPVSFENLMEDTYQTMPILA